MALNVGQLTKEMLEAAKPILITFWKDVKPFAEKELRSFAQNLVMIEKLKLQDKISKESAAIHIEIQKNSFRTVLLTVQGLGILAVEKALMAAISVVKGTINKTIGWNLL